MRHSSPELETVKKAPAMNRQRYRGYRVNLTFRKGINRLHRQKERTHSSFFILYYKMMKMVNSDTEVL